MMPCTFAIPATITRVVDGDTIVVQLSLRYLLRLSGIDTPELRIPEENEAAEIVRDAVQWWLAQQTNPSIVVSDHDKYGGRVIGDIIGNGGLCGWLLARGMAKPYAGGKKQPWTEGELRAILVQRGEYVVDRG